MAKSKDKPRRGSRNDHTKRRAPIHVSSGANSEPLSKSRILERRQYSRVDENAKCNGVSICSLTRTNARVGSDRDWQEQSRLVQPNEKSTLDLESAVAGGTSPPLLPSPPSISAISNTVSGRAELLEDHSQDSPGCRLQHVATVIYAHDHALDPKEQEPESGPRERMNTNGSQTIQRHQQPSHQHRDRKSHTHDALNTTLAATAGPMPSHIQVAKPYVFQQAVDGCLSDLAVAQAREDNIRLAGVRWIDDVRRALKLPVRTFDTAVVYYHKFRLSHADNEYSFVDAAAAALFAACKIEDTLKKSRDILCAAHNLKISTRADRLSPDDPIFEASSRTIIGLERLMLEASSFDFRNRHPQHLLVKIAKHYGYDRHSAMTKVAYQISLDLYRTLAPLKQSTATMVLACLELSARLHRQEQDNVFDEKEYQHWMVDRSMVMETLLDLLDLYTSYQPQTAVGPTFQLDAFLDIRIALNEELSTRHLPRYTEHITSPNQKRATSYAMNTTNGAVPAPNGINGRVKASPTSPATPGSSTSTPAIRQKAGERGKAGTVRFMLNPDRERQEKAITLQYAPLLASMRR